MERKYKGFIFMLIPLEYLIIYADYYWNTIIAYLLIVLPIYFIAKETEDIRTLGYILVCRIFGIVFSYVLNMMMKHPDNWDDYFKPLGSGQNVLTIGIRVLYNT
ncbi:hypothetical protein [Mammaliicoccus sciuri]|uniref:hypothetical protein n=1 Tax=Mammaliicoccus sciuri TaxID=1296 RepID=UPI001E2A5F7E|nr:hypothetical protein [Mammaliicoccus sciuri]MCD8898501.1 hypothetical protein [Mammaliicoccus sciuri]